MGEKWDDGDTRVSTNNVNIDILWLFALDRRNKGRCTNNIKSSDTKETFWVVDTVLLQDLGKDWNGRVDWVGDDQKVCFWAVSRK